MCLVNQVRLATMDIINGFLDKNGHPFFTIEVYGYNSQVAVKVDVMMDTGFTGFLSLPLTYCFQSGLILLSTATYTLADGSSSNTLLCMGTIRVNNISNFTGAISVSFNNPMALIGMDFLNKINGKLMVDTRAKIANIEFPKTIPRPVITTTPTSTPKNRSGAAKAK